MVHVCVCVPLDTAAATAAAFEHASLLRHCVVTVIKLQNWPRVHLFAFKNKIHVYIYFPLLLLFL